MYRFQTGGSTTTTTGTTAQNVGGVAVPADPLVGKTTGTESALSTWAGPTITRTLGRAEALSETPYQAYTGQLTAGPSALQTQAFQGLGGLNIPTAAQTSYTPGTFTAESAQQYMNPFLMAALQPQIDEARRQSQIQNLANKAAATRAGGLGGAGSALMQSEAQRNLQTKLGDITGKGYMSAYESAMNQFNKEQDRQMGATKLAQDYGLAALGAQTKGGELQRGIEQEGITADIKQFEEEREYPYKQLSWLQGLFQGMPVAAQNASIQQPGALSEILGGTGGILSLLETLFGDKSKSTTSSGTTPPPKP